MLTRSLLPLLLLFAATPAAAQNDSMAMPPLPSDPAPAQATTQPQPVTKAQPAMAAPVAGDWNREQAGALLAYIDRIGEEGLDPADYDRDGLRRAIEARGETLDRVATAVFLSVASDLMFGHVRGDARIDWYIEDDSWNVYDQQALLNRALAGGAIAETLNTLLPTHPQYAALKALLAAPTTDAAFRDQIRINLERWRWLPRDLGQKYVISNVPAYMVALVENGNVISRRRSVAGATKTPTPQLNATITGAILNPWWEVPMSIAPEVRGKKGYVRVAAGEGKWRYRQPPGPANALGRAKLVMPNPHAIYLHDTNAQGLFNRQQRAFSHGCIRTEDALGFFGDLLAGTEWTPEKIKATVASGKTVQANTAAPIPVYIVYFTVATTGDAPGYVAYKDLYGRDGKVLAALKDRGNTALASAGGN
ncbi:MAG: L,D-transpeptidase family protein [Allosphingosinicella sp.]